MSVGAAVFGILLGAAGGKNFSDGAYLTAFFGGLSDVSKSALLLRAFGSALLISFLAAIFGLPPLVFASVNSIRSSLSMLKICRRRTSPEFSSDAKFMLISCAVMFLFMLISRLTEIYIVPPILNVVSELYM